MNANSDAVLKRIDATVARLVLIAHRIAMERRPGYLEARKRLQAARMRRFRQLQ